MKDLFNLIQRVFNTSIEISLTTTPQDIENWDSLNHIKLIMILEEKYRVIFDPEEISISSEGVSKIIELLKNKGVSISS